MDKTRLLFKALREQIAYWTEITAEMVRGARDLEGTDKPEDYVLLREYLSTDETLKAFENVVRETSQGIVQSVLSLIDSTVDVDEDLRVSLVDRMTGEDLAPADSTYDDEFVGYMLEEDAGPDTVRLWREEADRKQEAEQEAEIRDSARRAFNRGDYAEVLRLYSQMGSSAMNAADAKLVELARKRMG